MLNILSLSVLALSFLSIFYKKKYFFIIIIFSSITFYFNLGLIDKYISNLEAFIIILVFFLILRNPYYYIYKINLDRFLFILIILIPIIYFITRNYYSIEDLIFSLRLFVSGILFLHVISLLRNNPKFIFYIFRVLIYIAISLSIISLGFITFFSNSYELKNFLIGIQLLPLIKDEIVISWSASNALSAFFTLHHSYAYYMYGCLGLVITMRFITIESNKFKNEDTLSKNYIYIILVLIIFSLSKTVIVASLIAVFLYIIFIKEKLSNLIILLALIPVIIYLSLRFEFYEYLWPLYRLLIAFVSNDLTIVEVLSETYTFQRRYEYIENSIILIKDNFFLGSGNFGFIGYNGFFAKPHDFWFLIIQKYGFLYFILVAIFLLRFIFKFQRHKPALVFWSGFIILTFGMSMISDLRGMLPYIFTLALLVEYRNIKNL